MMKSILFGVLVMAMVACAAPQPDEAEAPGSDTAAVEIAEVEEIEFPPEGSLPLSQIIASVEIAGHTAITEVEFEDGVWEVEFVVGGEEYQLEIDPMTGEAVSEEPERADGD